MIEFFQTLAEIVMRLVTVIMWSVRTNKRVQLCVCLCALGRASLRCAQVRACVNEAASDLSAGAWHGTKEREWCVCACESICEFDVREWVESSMLFRIGQPVCCA